MSLLSDILSKIKYPEPRKDIPPGLRSTITALKGREFNKKRIIILIGFILLALSSGLVTVYLVEIYLRGDKGHKTAISRHPATTIQSEVRTSDSASSSNNISKQDSQKKKSFEPSIEEKAKITNALEPKEKRIKTAPIASLQKGNQSKASTSTNRRKPELAKGKPATTTMPPAPHKPPAAVEKQPNADTSEKDLYLYMARNYEAKGDYNNALANYKKALKIEPDNYKVMNNIASILIMLSAHEEAKAYLQTALNIKSDYIPGHINMGIVLARLGDTETAESHLLHVLAIEPDNRHAILNIAILHEKQGNYEKAREYYVRLQRLGDEQGREGIERIKARRQEE